MATGQVITEPIARNDSVAFTSFLHRRGDFTSRADLAAKITSFAVRYNQTARPWNWTYDARAGHQQYCARNPATAGPATAHALPQAA